MQIGCRVCSTHFKIDQKTQDFYQRVSPIVSNKCYHISAPTLCPDCRRQRRLAFRNERNLYARNCTLCNKHMISMYSPDFNLNVYCQDCWWGDAWDGLDYSLEADYVGSFFEHFKKLFHAVPIINLYNHNSENSEYTNFAGMNNSCYLLFNSAYNEDCYYCRGIMNSRNCQDMYFGTKNELCFECINVHNCYHLLYSQNCHQCSDSYFLYNCRSCKNCIACTNLVNKEYFIFNEQATKEEYQEWIRMLSSSYSKIQELDDKYQHLVKEATHRANQNLNAEACTGDYIFNSNQCSDCFEANDCEDCYYCDSVKQAKDVRDAFGYAIYSELQYETVAVGRSQKVCFSLCCSQCSDVYYSAYCDQCHNVFGCVGLKHQKYCIFNKQYSKEEYFSLLPQVIEKMQAEGEWGEYFPPKLSPFGYNQTLGVEFYPMEKEDASLLGFNWSEFEQPLAEATKIVKADELPNNIQEVSDDILSWAIECESTNKLFRVIKQELDFYKENKLPIPRRSFNKRHRDRLARQNPRRLWKRHCDKCSTKILSSYSPERKEIIYCEECFREDVQ